MTRVKAIPIFQAAKVCGITGFMLGGISSCLGLLVVFMFSTESPIVTLSILVSLPIIGAISGVGGTALVCWLYNLSARWVGGLRFDLEEETVATRSTTEESAGPSAGYAGVDGGRGTAADRPGSAGVGREQPEIYPIRFYRLKLGPTSNEKPSPDVSSFRRPGDWVDVRNEGSSTARANGLCLYHLEHTGQGAQREYRFIVALPECSLKPGEVLRLHSGPRRDLSLLYAEDRNGAEWHAFTGGEAHFWNRQEGDTALLYVLASKETADTASYDPNPPEGVILWRQGDKLAGKPATVAVGRR